jgi:hypothetical protein
MARSILIRALRPPTRAFNRALPHTPVLFPFSLGKLRSECHVARGVHLRQSLGPIQIPAGEANGSAGENRRAESG